MQFPFLLFLLCLSAVSIGQEINPGQPVPIVPQPVPINEAQPVQAQPVPIIPDPIQQPRPQSAHGAPIPIAQPQAVPVPVQPIQPEPIQGQRQPHPVEAEPAQPAPIQIDHGIPQAVPIHHEVEQPVPIHHEIVQPAQPIHPAAEYAEPIQLPRSGQQVGPLNELELPDEDYKQFHENIHLFNDHHEEVLHDHDDGIVEEWSEHMDDFIPDMLVTFRLPARTDEYFYQEIGTEPTLIRGGYFVAGDNSTGPITFTILDPQGHVVIRRTRGESLFHFVAKVPGVYAFVMTNPHWVGDHYVTFVIGAGNETTLNIEHINSVNDNVMVIARMLRDIYSEDQYLWARQKAQMADVNSTQMKIWWLTFFELMTICAMAGVQVYLIKGLVSSRKLF